MTLLLGHDQAVAQWTAERIEHVGADGFGTIAGGIGIVSGNRLIAGCVYHDWQPKFGTIQLSLASESPMWARRENIKGLLAYAFDGLDVYKVWTATPSDITAAIRVNKHIGFTQEAILAHQFGRKRHGVICRMLRPAFDRLYGRSG